MRLEVETCIACGHEHVCAPFAGAFICQPCAKGEDCGRDDVKVPEEDPYPNDRSTSYAYCDTM